MPLLLNFLVVALVAVVAVVVVVTFAMAVEVAVAVTLLARSLFARLFPFLLLFLEVLFIRKACAEYSRLLLLLVEEHGLYVCSQQQQDEMFKTCMDAHLCCLESSLVSYSLLPMCC